MLERWTRRPTPAQALALRARLVLRCAAGETATAIARDLHVIKHTVGKWRGRFVAPTTDGRLDEPCPGVPRKITDAHVERVLTATLESTPRDATHWSTRRLAQHCDMSQTAIARIWKAFALQPHRVDTFKPGRIRYSSTKCATSWGCISIRPLARCIEADPASTAILDCP